MTSKKNILYIIVVFVVSTLGAFSYHQVAVVNAPKSPDDINPEIMTQDSKPDEKSQNIKNFESKEKDLKFNYPNNWTLDDNTPENKQIFSTNDSGTFGKILQSFVITNYDPSTSVSGGLPQNAVRFEGIISLGGKTKTLDQIIDCGGKTIRCENIEINGNQFKRATQVLNIGNTLIQLATKNQDKIYLFTFVVSSGNEQQKLLTEAEQIIKSIVVIK